MAVSTIIIADIQNIERQHNHINEVHAYGGTVQDIAAPIHIRQPQAAPRHTVAPRTAVIATLGGKAQVLTFALDWLLKYTALTSALPPVERVYSLNFSPRDQRMQTCLGQLRHEFAHWPAYTQLGLRLD